MPFVNTPNSGGAHLGSAFDGGYEGYLLKTLEQLRGQPVTAPFSSAITATLVRQPDRPAAARRSTGALATGVLGPGHAPTAARPTVASWTLVPRAPPRPGQTMPQFDAIAFRALGIVGQPAIDWQNRPTFQQVVNFPGTGPASSGARISPFEAIGRAFVLFGLTRRRAQGVVALYVNGELTRE